MHQNHGSGITTFHICDTAILIGIALKGDWELLHYQVPILRLQRFQDCQLDGAVLRSCLGQLVELDDVAKCGKTMSSRFCFQCLDVNLSISGRYSLHFHQQINSISGEPKPGVCPPPKNMNNSKHVKKLQKRTERLKTRIDNPNWSKLWYTEIPWSLVENKTQKTSKHITHSLCSAPWKNIVVSFDLSTIRFFQKNSSLIYLKCQVCQGNWQAIPDPERL